MEVLPGPLPDGRRSGGDEGLGSRLHYRRINTCSNKQASCHCVFWVKQLTELQSFSCKNTNFRTRFFIRILQLRSRSAGSCTPYALLHVFKSTRLWSWSDEWSAALNSQPSNTAQCMQINHKKVTRQHTATVAAFLYLSTLSQLCEVNGPSKLFDHRLCVPKASCFPFICEIRICRDRWDGAHHQKRRENLERKARIELPAPARRWMDTSTTGQTERQPFGHSSTDHALLQWIVWTAACWLSVCALCWKEGVQCSTREWLSPRRHLAQVELNSPKTWTTLRMTRTSRQPRTNCKGRQRRNSKVRGHCATMLVKGRSLTGNKISVLTKSWVGSQDFQQTT